jgi:hypothetical protein
MQSSSSFARIQSAYCANDHKKRQSTFSEFYLDDRVKDQLSINTIETKIKGFPVKLSDEILKLTVKETTTQAPTMIGRL